MTIFSENCSLCDVKSNEGVHELARRRSEQMSPRAEHKIPIPQYIVNEVIKEWIFSKQVFWWRTYIGGLHTKRSFP